MATFSQLTHSTRLAEDVSQTLKMGIFVCNKSGVILAIAQKLQLTSEFQGNLLRDLGINSRRLAFEFCFFLSFVLFCFVLSDFLRLFDRKLGLMACP